MNFVRIDCAYSGTLLFTTVMSPTSRGAHVVLFFLNTRMFFLFFIISLFYCLLPKHCCKDLLWMRVTPQYLLVSQQVAME